MVPSTHTPKNERRTHHRLGFRCPVSWDFGQDASVTRPGFSRDVSETGAGFVTRRISAPTIGDQIRITFELDDVNEWLVDNEARVVRCDKVDDKLCSVGVELSSMGLT